MTIAVAPSRARSVRRRSGDRISAPLWVAALVVTVVVAVPLAYLGVRASERGWGYFADTVFNRRTWQLTLNSLTLTATVTAISTTLGVGAAYLVTRTALVGGAFWRVALALPFALPSYITAWAWIAYRPEVAGRLGATIVLVSTTYPFVYLPALGALRRRSPGLEDVATALGRSPLQTFWSVTIRQVASAVAGGAVLVALYSMSEFSAVTIMRYESLTQSIYRSYQGATFDRHRPAVLGCLLVAVMIVPVLVAASTTRRRVADVGGTSPHPPTRHRLGWWQLPIQAVLVALVGICLGVPTWNIARWVAAGRSETDWSVLRTATLTTLGIGLAAAALTIVLAIPLGVLAARHPGRLSTGLTSAVYAAHALPGIVVALALVYFGIRTASPIYQRTPLLLFAYVVLFLSLAVGAVQNAIARIPPALHDVARSLGRSPLRAWLSVTLRVAAPGIAAGAALVFLAVAKELPATLLLRPIGTDTLASQLWSHTSGTQRRAAAPYAAMLVLVAAIPTALLTAERTRR